MSEISYLMALMRIAGEQLGGEQIKPPIRERGGGGSITYKDR